MDRRCEPFGCECDAFLRHHKEHSRFTTTAGKLRVHDLREKDKAELEQLLTEHRKQLGTLRVEQVSQSL